MKSDVRMLSVTLLVGTILALALIGIAHAEDTCTIPPDGTVYSNVFEGSANQYLPGDPDADMLYVVTVARNCNGVGGLCMQVGQPTFIDINGDPYTCDPPLDLNQAEMFFLWRSYMEPATKVSPDDNELLYDRAIYFGPYFSEQ